MSEAYDLFIEPFQKNLGGRWWVINDVWYDILKGKPDGTRLWVESLLTNVQRATEQMNRIAARVPDNYFIVDPAAGKVVASVGSYAASPTSTKGRLRREANAGSGPPTYLWL